MQRHSVKYNDHTVAPNLSLRERIWDAAKKGNADLVKELCARLKNFEPEQVVNHLFAIVMAKMGLSEYPEEG